MIATPIPWDPTLWAPQLRGLMAREAAIARGVKSMCVALPTGGGKSRMMIECVKRDLARGQTSALIVNRKMLRQQLSEVFTHAGISHSVRASGVGGRWGEPVQICSLQTLGQRVLRTGREDLPLADNLYIDELHNMVGTKRVTDDTTGKVDLRAGEALEIARRYLAAGATVTGFTATPVGIGHAVQELIVAGTNSDLRACGSHVVCHTFAPDEPDARTLKPRVKTGEEVKWDALTKEQRVKAIMTPSIYGRVYGWWSKLNPDALPCLGFAPGVNESIWFCEQGASRGIRCAHIDGDSCWLGGKTYGGAKNEALRHDIREMSREGKIKIVWNRFVMREGIDWPWLYHGIMACVFGELQSYLQAGGRLVRSYPGLDHVILQDHGGNFWRHGDLNLDRDWKLGDTSKAITDWRLEAYREYDKPEPITCSQCAFVRASGNACPKCHYMAAKRSRMVIQQDGKLIEMTGKRLKPRSRQRKANTQELWTKVFQSMKRAKGPKTWKQAEAFFFRKHGYYPPRDLKFMPKHPADWMRRVKAVKLADLN